MFRVSRKQEIAIAERMALERFERDIIPHLFEFSPRHARMLGPTGLRTVARLAVDRAHVYDMTNPGLLRFYVELMFMYGSFFDTDPLLPWAGESLRDGGASTGQARATRLYDQMSWYYDSVSGEDLALDRAALFRGEPLFSIAASRDDRHLDAVVIGALSMIHPRRTAYLGEARLRQLVGAAAAKARQLEIDDANRVGIVAFLMFTKGHEFANDPVVGWAGAALRKEATSSATRGQRLQRAYERYRHDLRGLAPPDAMDVDSARFVLHS
jgi:hypothetical protein